jgi:hypothetical protein
MQCTGHKAAIRGRRGATLKVSTGIGSDAGRRREQLIFFGTKPRQDGHSSAPARTDGISADNKSVAGGRGDAIPSLALEAAIRIRLA